MDIAPTRLLGSSGGWHPVVLNRRIRELALLGGSAVVPLVLALVISVAVPRPNVPLLLAAGAGVLCIVVLVASPRYEVTVTIVVLYLGLLDGPVKLGIGGHESVSAVRDVLIFAVCLGAGMRLLVNRERVILPPLSAWVLLYVALVLVEAFNPRTAGITKTLGGFRQLLEWVPFFFFGYAIVRSKQRLRRVCLVLGVIALANGVVSVYQSRLSPSQLASWGPGYAEVALGTKGLGGRSFISEGVARVRPPGLGTDAGYAGGVGVIALPAALALFAFRRRRRRWPLLLLCLGSMLAVASGLGRLQLIGTIIALLSFGALSLSVGRRAIRPILAVLAVMIVAIPVGAVLVSSLGSGTFSRYESIVTGENDDASKLPGLTHVPTQLARSPFGAGLSVAGAAAGFGGLTTQAQEGHSPDAETQYNFLADELGVPGLLLWIGLIGTLLTLSLTGLRRIRDTELFLELAALFSSFVAITIMGFYGPTLTSSALGPFFWFFAGTAAYWFAGPGREAQESAATLAGGEVALAGAGTMP